MHQIMNSIMSDGETRSLLFEDHNIVVTMSENIAEGSFRREFLDRYRKQIYWDPAARAEVIFQAGGITFETGIMSTNNPNINYAYENYERHVKQRLSSSPDVNIEMRKIHFGLFRFDPDFDPITFKHEDYDSKPARENFKDQMPLGRQNIYQLVKNDGVDEDLNLSLEYISSRLQQALKAASIVTTVNRSYDGVGDGVVVISLSLKGSVVAVWDGRATVSMNLFTYEESIGTPEKFINSFLEQCLDKMKVGLRDDQPRGVNHVINFPSDLVSSKTRQAKVFHKTGEKRPHKMKKLPNGEYIPYDKEYP
jgi:hypothetical protein